MQLALQQVMKIRMYDPSTDAPRGILKFLKEATFENGGEVTNLTQNGTPISSISHSKSCTISGNSAVIDENLMSLQIGKDVEILANTTEIRIQEVITTTVADEATLSYTPSGVVGAEIGFAELINSDGEVLKTFIQMASPATVGKFSYGTKKLSFFASDVPIGSRIRVSYYPTIASARKISNLANKLTATVRAEVDVILQDACTNVERKGLITIPKASFGAGFSFATSEAGEFAVHDFVLTALASCEDTKLWDLYTYDSSDIQA